MRRNGWEIAAMESFFSRPRKADLRSGGRVRDRFQRNQKLRLWLSSRGCARGWVTNAGGERHC